MGTRRRDWFDQAERDLGHARHSRAAGDHEWACFASPQAAEKALKALILSLGGEPWGHSVFALDRALPSSVPAPPSVTDAARDLDKLYIPTRDPNGFDQGKPGDYFTDRDSSDAIERAKAVVEFNRGHLPPA